jgi:hypothetical protein
MDAATLYVIITMSDGSQTNGAPVERKEGRKS